MPLRLIPPRHRNPSYYIRGTYLGQKVFQSTRTGVERIARQALRKIKEDIEDGKFASSRGTLFADAVTAYLSAGGDGTYLEKLVVHFEGKTIEEIDQIAVDDAAEALYPKAKPATRNRQVHTPVSAVINHVNPNRMVRFNRPKGDAARTVWLEPEQFELLYEALPAQHKPLAVFLVYSGCRLGEAVKLDWQTVNLERRVIVIPKTKNDDPRSIHVTDRMFEELSRIPSKKGRVFGFRDRWAVSKGWRIAATKIGLPWASPHVLCHTWATWMRQYAGAEPKTLIATGRWRDVKSVMRYMHAVPGEDAKKTELLPDKRGQSAGDRRKSLKVL